MKPGIYDITAAEYHADPCEQPSLTASIARLFTTASPLHVWTAHPKLNPAFHRQHEDKFDVGTASHALLLQGENIVRVVDADDWRKKSAQEERIEAREQHLIPLLAREWEKVQAMTSAVRDQLAQFDHQPALLTAGKPERMLVWEDEGVACRAMLDWLHDDCTAIDDLKTTKASANPYMWARRTLWSIGADVQVAFYLRGLKKLTASDAEFRYIVAETSPLIGLCGPSHILL